MSSLRRSVGAAAFALAMIASHVASADEPPPPPATDAPVAQPPQATTPDPCAGDWKKRVYFASRDSIVRLDPIGFTIEGLAPMSGFVYLTRSHVLALSDAIGVGRGVLVTFNDGKVIHARAVAVDHVNRLSILALESEAPAPPLEVSERPLGVGDEIASIAPFDGQSVARPDELAGDTRLQMGHVANAGDRTQLRFDGQWAVAKGTPVFTCEGKVVALRNNDTLIAGGAIRALQPAAKPIDDLAWSIAHVHAGLLIQADSSRAYIGGSFGTSLVYADRFQLRLGLGVLAGVPKEDERAANSYNAARLQLEPTLGYRMLLSEKLPLYVVPQVGAVGRVDFVSRTQAAYFATDPACFSTPGPCAVDQRLTHSTSTSYSLAPVVGVSLLGVLAGVSYQWQIDVNDVRKSTHQIFFGLEF